MANDEEPNPAQQFEQAIATLFACHTIIKYNSTLNEEQKDDILTHLDTTLQFLQKRLVADAVLEANAIVPPLSSQQLAGLLASSMRDDEENEDDESEMAGIDYPASPKKQVDSEQILQNLYKLYHAYLNTQPGKGINVLETRYKNAMDILCTVQDFIEKERFTSSGERLDQHLYQVRGFISALYYIFREFAAVLTRILEGKDMGLETDELTSLQAYTARGMHQSMLRDVTPLLPVYGAHLRLQQHKGSVSGLMSDATAFLIFLGERLAPGTSRQEEIVEQLRAVAELLHDLSSLLANYEQALSVVLPR